MFRGIKKISLQESMTSIKNDLKKLGIQHDNFSSESDLVKQNLVGKAIKDLQSKNFVEEGYLNPPKGEIPKDWKKLKDFYLNQQSLGMTQIEHCKRMMDLGPTLQMMLHIITIKY